MSVGRKAAKSLCDQDVYNGGVLNFVAHGMFFKIYFLMIFLYNSFVFEMCFFCLCVFAFVFRTNSTTQLGQTHFCSFE